MILVARRKLKLLMTTLFAFVIVLSISTTETEAAMSNAPAIQFGQTYQGIINSYYQEDYYKITVPSNGNVKLSITRKADASWNGAILDSNGNEFQSFYTDSDEMVTGQETREVGLPPGTYYIKITGSYNTFGFVYKFKVDFTASNYYETEANDSLSTADTILVNKLYNGNLSDYYDEDFYKFTLTKPGKVTLSMKQQSGVTWYAHIQDTKGNIYESFYSDSSEMVIGNATADVGLPAGTYYVKIDYSSSAENVPYQFQIKYLENSTYEKEFNDTLSTSNTIKVNTTYKGHLNDNYDQDFSKFTLSKAGNVKLAIKQKAGATWYAHIQDSKGNTYDYVYTDGSELVLGYAYIEVGLPAGTYYIKISGYDEDEQYEFKVNYTESSYYEKEFNNSLSVANLISLNKTYKGVIQNNDKDFYKVTVPIDGVVNVSLSQSPGRYWYYQILDSTGKVISYKYTDSSDLVSGNANIRVSLKKGTYYIQVSGSYNTEGTPYSLMAYMKSPTLTATLVKVVNNNTGVNDTVSVSGISKGDVIKVYNQSSGGTLLGSVTSTSTSAKVSIKQLGIRSGKVYVTVTKKYMLESARAAVSFNGEKTAALTTSKVKITNNKGTNDKIYVSSLEKGSIIRIYNSSGKLLLKSNPVTTTTSTSYIKQLGTTSGVVYISVQRTGMQESSKTKVAYSKE
ncbi:Bacterial pre-peptidase C-terminal domain [Mycobacteroides abscessus subsp. abscessus]|nr:Bacterial pre-peptidase C-terminal domain [Mycobacteroides abscessus subsp. abscessus]